MVSVNLCSVGSTAPCRKAFTARQRPCRPSVRSVTVCAAAEPEANVTVASRRGLLAAAAAAIAVSLAPAADAKVAQRAPDPYEEFQKILKERGQSNKGLLSSFQQSQSAASKAAGSVAPSAKSAVQKSLPQPLAGKGKAPGGLPVPKGLSPPKGLTVPKGLTPPKGLAGKGKPAGGLSALAPRTPVNKPKPSGGDVNPGLLAGAGLAVLAAISSLGGGKGKKAAKDVAGKLKPEVPSLPNPASPEVKQAASQAVDAVKGKEASAVEAAAPTAPNAILLGLAAAGLVGAGVVATQQGGAPDGTSSGSGSGAPTAAAPAQKSGEDPAEEAKKRAAEARKWIEAWRSKK